VPPRARTRAYLPLVIGFRPSQENRNGRDRIRPGCFDKWYGVAKLAAERYCVSFSRVYPLETVSLRYFNVFGPRQDPRSEYAAVVPRFITQLAVGRRAPVYGDGEQRRDFTYVANVVEANLLAGETVSGNGLVLNIATGRSTSVNELAETIGSVLGREAEREYFAARPGDILASWADVSAAREALGWQPHVDLKEGLRATAESFL
jgi:UDP-glucose 4-epimerase